MKMITKEELEEFRNIYRVQFGIELTDAQALDKAIRLVRLMKVVLTGKPLNTTKSNDCLSGPFNVNYTNGSQPTSQDP